jgi:hypothetical protein
MSIISKHPGEDEAGGGGVVEKPEVDVSPNLPPPRARPIFLPLLSAFIIVAVVKRARRGVGNIGLLYC